MGNKKPLNRPPCFRCGLPGFCEKGFKTKKIPCVVFVFPSKYLVITLAIVLPGNNWFMRCHFTY